MAGCSTPYPSFMSYDMQGHDKLLPRIKSLYEPDVGPTSTFQFFRTLPWLHHRLEPPRVTTYWNVIVSLRGGWLSISLNLWLREVDTLAFSKSTFSLRNWFPFSKTLIPFLVIEPGWILNSYSLYRNTLGNYSFWLAKWPPQHASLLEYKHLKP